MHLDPWTFALQTVNLLVLVWILARFLFRPIASIIADRRAAAAEILAEAEATRAKAAQAAAELDRQRAGMAEHAERIVADARATAAAEHASLLRETSEAAARIKTDAAKAIDHEREVMRRELEQEATGLAVSIAQRLLERVPPQVLVEAFLDKLAETLSTHPARALLAHEALELRSAVVLDAAAQAQCRAALANVLGANPELIFLNDPSLIAGVELAAPHAEIRVSWRADLDRINQLLLANHAHDTEAQRVA